MPGLVERFNEAVRRHDTALNAELLADDVKLFGVLWKPFEGEDAVVSVFAMLQDPPSSCRSSALGKSAPELEIRRYRSLWEGLTGVASKSLRAQLGLGGKMLREFGA